MKCKPLEPVGSFGIAGVYSNLNGLEGWPRKEESIAVGLMDGYVSGRTDSGASPRQHLPKRVPETGCSYSALPNQ